MIRAFDCSLAVALILLAAPLFIIVAFLIKVTSIGPIFYKDKRVGLNSKEFLMYKFRSMIVNQPAKQNNWMTLNNDPRITFAGKFIRKTSIDELPQLINVVIGDMSLVGPRPESPNSIDCYPVSYWEAVHKIRPGITGLAQINGRSSLKLSQKIDFDIEYLSKVKKLSRLHCLLYNIKIMLMTIKVLIPNQNTN